MLWGGVCVCSVGDAVVVMVVRCWGYCVCLLYIGDGVVVLLRRVPCWVYCVCLFYVGDVAVLLVRCWGYCACFLYVGDVVAMFRMYLVILCCRFEVCSVCEVSRLVVLIDNGSSAILC